MGKDFGNIQCAGTMHSPNGDAVLSSHSDFDSDSLWDTQNVATYLKLRPRQVEAMRLSGDTPQFLRLSRRCIRYRPRDVVEWAAARLRRSTADLGDFGNEQ